MRYACAWIKAVLWIHHGPNVLVAKRQMQDVTNKNFGLVIAYLLPGYILLWGLGDAVSNLDLHDPFQAGTSESGAVTIGGFLNETLMSLAVSMMLSTVRWAVIDTIHHHTGVKRPVWDDSKLQANLQAFDTLVEYHYRFYQFHANTFVGLFIIFAARRPDPWLFDLVFILVLASLFGASRDALKKYYQRAVLLLNETERNTKMSNGAHTPRDKSTTTPESASPTKKTVQRSPDPKATPQKISAETKGGSGQDRSS